MALGIPGSVQKNLAAVVGRVLITSVGSVLSLIQGVGWRERLSQSTTSQECICMLTFLAMVENREQKLLRVLYHLARVSISQVSTGFVATSGKAQITETLLSPLLGRRCIAYQLTVFFKDRAPPYEWRPLPDIFRCADFLLKDNSGEARVLGHRADVALVRSEAIQTAHQPRDIQHILEPLGLRQESSPIWYVQERVLLDGDETFVAGVATREPVPGAQRGYREQPQDRPLLQVKDGLPLAVSNNRIVRETSKTKVAPQML